MMPHHPPCYVIVVCLRLALLQDHRSNRTSARSSIRSRIAVSRACLETSPFLSDPVRNKFLRLLRAGNLYRRTFDSYGTFDWSTATPRDTYIYRTRGRLPEEGRRREPTDGYDDGDKHRRRSLRLSFFLCVFAFFFFFFLNANRNLGKCHACNSNRAAQDRDLDLSRSFRAREPRTDGGDCKTSRIICFFSSSSSLYFLFLHFSFYARGIIHTLPQKDESGVSALAMICPNGGV